MLSSFLPFSLSIILTHSLCFSFLSLSRLVLFFLLCAVFVPRPPCPNFVMFFAVNSFLTIPFHCSHSNHFAFTPLAFRVLSLPCWLCSNVCTLSIYSSTLSAAHLSIHLFPLFSGCLRILLHMHSHLLACCGVAPAPAFGHHSCSKCPYNAIQGVTSCFLTSLCTFHFRFFWLTLRVCLFPLALVRHFHCLSLSFVPPLFLSSSLLSILLCCATQALESLRVFVAVCCFGVTVSAVEMHERCKTIAVADLHCLVQFLSFHVDTSSFLYSPSVALFPAATQLLLYVVADTLFLLFLLYIALVISLFLGFGSLFVFPGRIYYI